MARRAVLGAAVVLVAVLPDVMHTSPGALRLAWVALVALGVGMVLAVPALTAKVAAVAGRRRTVVVAVVGFLALGLVLTWLRLRAYQDANGRDLAYHCQVLWNTVHGRFGEGSILQELYFDPPLRNHTGLHVSPSLLALVPLYALVPGQTTLLVVKLLATASCALPLYVLARRALGAAPAGLLTLAYLLHPTVLEQTRHEFYPIDLAAPLLLWTWWAWERRRLGVFVACGVLFVGVREDLALMYAAFAGVWALEWWGARRSAADAEPLRPVRWGLVPGIVGIVWFVVSTKIVMPAFGGGAVAGNVMAWYSGFGNSPDDLVRRVVGDPVFVLGTLLAVPKLLYLWRLLRPLLFAPLAGRAVLLAVPALAINMLVTGPHPTIAVTAHYSVAIVAALGAAAVGGLARLRRRRGDGAVLAATIVLFGVSLSALSDTFHAAARKALTRPADVATIEAALALVPAHASVAAPNAFLAHVADTEFAYDSEQVGHYPPFRTDVVILDLDASRSTLDERDDAAVVARDARFRADPDYRVALDRDGIVVFVRVRK